MISENVRRILAELPNGVELVVAAKTRTPQEVAEVIEGGASIIGENYVQEAEEAQAAIGDRVRWHFIGHLQRNKVKKAVGLFDMIETVDSASIAREIDRRCLQIGKTMEVLIEINSGREPQKSGVLPEEAQGLIEEISSYSNIRVMGLMTMGPYPGTGETMRPCFAATKRLFEELKALNTPNVEMRYLSMGMSASYRVAIEEGANIVRIGSIIFGPRGGGAT